jgi:hypothetical protein
MAVRKRGRTVIEVGGRRFVWHVHRETHVRIASEDKRFGVAYRWVGEPELSVSGPEFPGLSPSDPRPIVLRPPAFAYRSPAELARQVIQWALFSGEQPGCHPDA